MDRKLWITLITFSGLMLFLSTAFMTPSANDPWPVPDKYQKMKNPVAANADVISLGKELYIKHCKSCHGTKGLGDGSKAAQLETDCGNFSLASFQSQSDGAIFYKTSEGRGDMPSFKKKIPVQEDIWSVVHYLRTLKK